MHNGAALISALTFMVPFCCIFFYRQTHSYSTTKKRTKTVSLSVCVPGRPQMTKKKKTLPPQSTSVTFVDKQRPRRMLQVCAHNSPNVCVCVCVVASVHLCAQFICSSATEEGSHKMMGISKLGCSC